MEHVILRKNPESMMIHRENITKCEGEPNGFKAFYNQKNQFLGYGYLCEQHKAAGFILTKEKEPLDVSFFTRLFKKARARRDYYFAHQDTTSAFRLFNAEGDGLGGLTIDLYNDYAVFSFYNEVLYKQRFLLLEAFTEVFKDVVKGSYLKIRFQSDCPVSQHFAGDIALEPFSIVENGVKYEVALDEGWMTGIFLDQHEVRGRLVDGQACGMKVLNAFSYTGAFSIAAAMGGAYQTVSVDLASRSLEKTKENFIINGLNPEDHEIRVMDIFSYCDWAKKKEIQFDMVILDPPSFARNGKKTFSVAKDYGKLVAAILPLVKEEGGIIICSTNSANVSLPHYRAMIEETLQKEYWNYEELFFDSLPKDFVVSKQYKEGNYLKVCTYGIQKNKNRHFHANFTF